jgi:L-ascorbate metabolism protein UlaG (beta-lactamase superfamily)
MKKEEKNCESLLEKNYTRREFFKLGLLGAVFLTGSWSMTPTGEKLTSRLGEEVTHTTVKAKLRPNPEKWRDDEVTVAWLGHASFLINFLGTRIITDPALGLRVGLTPLGDATIGPSRYIMPALTSNEVGPLDLLLVSHAHTDHFDYPTLRRLQSANTVAVTAQNTTPLWQGMNFGSVAEMKWGDTKSLAGVKVRAIEGKHWGARLPWNTEMEANSFLLSKNGVNIFFGGDTGYTELIKQQLDGIPIDLAIMGIAAYSPKSLEARHATPEQAWRMAEEMAAQWIMPMHWGTFKLSNEPMNEPIARFHQAAQGKMEKVALQEIGATWTLPRS